LSLLLLDCCCLSYVAIVCCLLKFVSTVVVILPMLLPLDVAAFAVPITAVLLLPLLLLLHCSLPLPPLLVIG